ncbi:MAG: hypothetical protein WAV04_02465 [Candidatus Microsaccharimonas sp.]
MTNIDGLKVPYLDWGDADAPGPMRILEESDAIRVRLRDELGREPTAEEHYVALQERLGHLSVEVTEEQRREAVTKAKEMIQELTEFIETYGGRDD